jgi:hypothetical protein
MKKLGLVALIVLTSVAVHAQGSLVRSGSDATVESGSRLEVRTRGGSTLSSMIAYGSFSIGGEERFGPMVLIQYSPNRFSTPAIDLFGGVLFQTGTSGSVDERNSVPLASYFAPYYSPYSDYRNDYAYRMPRLSVGLGYLGADVTFYMLQGDVRPYVGFGGSLAFWSFSSQLSSTLAPDAKAGLDIHLSNSLSGFAEVRRLFGVPNLLGTSLPRFDGLTSAAVGVSFAPRLR